MYKIVTPTHICLLYHTNQAFLPFDKFNTNISILFIELMKYRCHEKNPLREGGGYLGEIEVKSI